MYPQTETLAFRINKNRTEGANVSNIQKEALIIGDIRPMSISAGLLGQHIDQVN